MEDTKQSQDYQILKIPMRASIPWGANFPDQHGLAKYLKGGPLYLKDNFEQYVHYPMFVAVRMGYPNKLIHKYSQIAKNAINPIAPKDIDIEDLARTAVKDRKCIVLSGLYISWPHCLYILNLLDNISEQQKKMLLEDHSIDIFYTAVAFFYKY